MSFDKRDHLYPDEYLSDDEEFYEPLIETVPSEMVEEDLRDVFSYDNIIRIHDRIKTYVEDNSLELLDRSSYDRFNSFMNSFSNV